MLGAGETILDRRRKLKKTSRAEDTSTEHILVTTSNTGQVTSHSFIDQAREADR
jgi:hypothetical protein